MMKGLRWSLNLCEGGCGEVNNRLECLVAFEMAARCFVNMLLILKKAACVYQP